MSHLRIKRKYNTEGSFGSTEEKTLYCHHNLSSDYVAFYDENGDIIMVVPDTIDNNILDAINELYDPFSSNIPKYKEGIELMTIEEIKRIIK